MTRPTSTVVPAAAPREMRPAEELLEWLRADDLPAQDGEEYWPCNERWLRFARMCQADAFEAGRAAGRAEGLEEAVWACELEKRSLDHMEDCGCRYVCDRCKTRIEALARPATPAEKEPR